MIQTKVLLQTHGLQATAFREQEQYREEWEQKYVKLYRRLTDMEKRDELRKYSFTSN